MAKNLSRKILEAHLAKPSEMIPGEEIYLKVDQTLTHDINAVMTYLAFEQIGLDRTQVETSVSYLDHNLLYWIIKHRMIIFICSLLQRNTEFMCRDRETASVMPYMLPGLERLESCLWAATATPLMEVPSV